MKKATLMFCWLVLVSATLVSGSETAVQADPVKEIAEVTAEATETEDTAETATEGTPECSVAEVTGEDSKVLAGFGPHCSTPFTCTYQEPGLGFGCTCTYSCSCAYCNGQLTRINCVLIDDGGCMSCPS